MIYDSLFILPFMISLYIYDLNFTIGYKGSGVHARHLANARGARGSLQIFLVHEQVHMVGLKGKCNKEEVPQLS